MCGITGWVDWDRDLTAERDVVLAMTETMARRGPDAGGIWLSPRAALGHRRLAVIDIEGGAQPMIAHRPEPVVLTYSGEVYNFPELRAELEARGHHFRTRSDTEVVLHAYLEWGADCVSRLNGMFAFAIWDDQRQELLLARDRLGIKPLYYAEHRSGVLFGSEPKALLANPLFQPELDAEGLGDLLVLTMARRPGNAIFRGLREVRPGHIVRVARNSVRESAYWQLTSRPHTDDLPTTVATLRSLLEDIVARQLISDVPLCTLLSGGLDSSTITALASRSLRQQRRGEVVTFAVDFTGSEHDFQPSTIRPDRDAPFVQAVAEHIHARHTDIVLDTPDLLAQQEVTLRARDLPGMGDMDTSLYLLCREIRRYSTVALSGESADEVFGGYPWFHDERALSADTFPWLVSFPRSSGLSSLFSDEVGALVRPGEYIADRYAEALSEVPYLDGETGRDRRMREIFYLNLTRFLPNLLDRKDRMSMAVGLEVRVPFCDHRLVDYVWNIPWEMKTAGNIEKGILRLAIADLLPEPVVTRRKSAYPSMTSPAYEAAVRDATHSLLADARAPVFQLFDREKVRAAIHERRWDSRDVVSPAAWLAHLQGINRWMQIYRVRLV